MMRQIISACFALLTSTLSHAHNLTAEGAASNLAHQLASPHHLVPVLTIVVISVLAFLAYRRWRS